MDEVVIENADAIGKPNLGPDFTPDNEGYQKLVDHCMDLYNLFKDSTYREQKIKEITESRKVYEQKSEKAMLPWEHDKIVLPLVTITNDNLEPRLVSGLIGRMPIVRFEMEGVQEQDEPTKILESWFNQELMNEVKIETHAMTVIHTVLMEGTWFGIPEYNRNELKRRDFVFSSQGLVIDPQTQKPATVDKVDVLFEGGEVQHIPFSDIYCADDLGTMEEWGKGDKAVMIRPTYAELMRNKRDGKQGWLPDKIGPWLVGHKTDRKISETDQTPDQKTMGVEVSGKEVIKCLNFYLTYPINRIEDAPEEEQEDFTEERIFCTIAVDSKVLIRLGLLRDFNFSNECSVKRIRLFPEVGRSFGTSMYGKLKAIQNGASDLLDTISNIAMLCMIPWYFYDDSSGLKKDVELYPGQGVKVDNVQGILIPDFFKLNPSNYLSFINLFLDLWERLGNISNPQVGRPDDKQKTATEIMNVIQEGNIKYDYQSKTTKDEFIGVIKTLYDLYYQYMPFNKTINYGGKQVPIPRQAMRQKVKFTLSGSTAAANKMIERKEAEEIDMMAGQNPLMNPMKTLEDRLKAYGKTDVSAYINPEVKQVLQALFENPEIPQVMAHYLKSKQEMQTQAGVKPKVVPQGAEQ